MIGEMKDADLPGCDPGDKCCAAPPPYEPTVTLSVPADEVLRLVKADGEREVLADRLDCLTDEFNQMVERNNDLERLAVRDAVVLGRYRSAAFYALGLIDSAIEADACVTAGDRNRLREFINQADHAVAGLIALTPAGGQ